MHIGLQNEAKCLCVLLLLSNAELFTSKVLWCVHELCQGHLDHSLATTKIYNKWGMWTELLCSIEGTVSSLHYATSGNNY